MEHHTPAADVPWVVSSPFRMRPGLSRLEPTSAQDTTVPLFLRDAQAAAYTKAKQAVLQAHRQKAQVGRADPQVLRAIATAYRVQTGSEVEPGVDALTAALQEDFVILHDESEAGADVMRAHFLSVCFPSNWNPVEKHGLDFSAIHAPVADNALLQAGARGIVDMAFRQSPMLRHVWLLTPNGDLAQHPESRRRHWEDAVAEADAPGASGRLLDQVFFRVERQTTLPLPALRRSVFFIRVMVAPLTGVLAVAPRRSTELAEALTSMSEAVLAYRGMTAVRERLCAELRRS